MKIIKKLLLAIVSVATVLTYAQPVIGNTLSEASIARKQSDTILDIKFADTDEITLVDGMFVNGKGENLTQINDALNDGKVAKKGRLFTADKDKIKKQRKDLIAKSNIPTPDLNNYYRIVLSPGIDIDSVANTIKQLPGIMDAYAEPLPAKSPISPDYTNLQTHFTAAPAGMGISAASSYPGALGESVSIADLEYSWNTAHQDLSDTRQPDALIANGTPVDPWSDTNHGTAVTGLISGDNNNYGVTGIIPNSKLHLVNTNNSENGWDIANAIYKAQSTLVAGDIILIEQQTWGPTGHGYVPVEWIGAVYDAIKVTTANGIIVVEAAANGSENLDDPAFGTSFPQGKPDSGAIIAGAGTACNGTNVHSRMSFSNYGKRVNVQGYGECVTTSGYGYLNNAAGVNAWYTNSFNGTSSASALIAAVAGSVSSSYKSQKGIPMTPLQLRNLLTTTGTAQDMVTAGSIGPLPNLESALKSFSVIADTTPPTVPLNLQASLTKDNKVALNWNASSDNSGRVTYKIYRNNVLIAFTGNTAYIDTTVARKTSYTYKVQAIDPSGNLSGFSNNAVIRTR